MGDITRSEIGFEMQHKDSALKKLRIAHLTSVHRVFDTRIFHKECKTLSATGYKVILIAPHERNELVDGIRICSLPKPRNRLERMTRTSWQVFRAALTEEADFYHFHDPELIPIGILLKIWGRQVIYDVHEGVPEDILTKTYIKPLFRRVMATLVGLAERMGASCFDAIVAATPAIARRFPPGKTFTVQNFPNLHELVSAEPSPYLRRPLQITYVGEITAIRGIREMVQAMSQLPQNSQIKLSLVGSFDPPELEQEVRKIPGWERVDYLGWQSREKVAGILSESRIGIVLFHPVPNHTEAQPNKLFEYMSASIPVVASDFPLWRKIIAGARCGLLVDPLKPEAIAEAIKWLLEHPDEGEAMGRRGRQAVNSLYNWDNESRRLLSLYARFFPPQSGQDLSPSSGRNSSHV